MLKFFWMLFFLVLRGNHYSEFDEYISTYLLIYLSIYQMDPQAIYPMFIWDPGEVVVKSTCLDQCLNYSLGLVESPTKIINLQPFFSVRKLFLFHKMKLNTLFSQHDIMISLFHAEWVWRSLLYQRGWHEAKFTYYLSRDRCCSGCRGAAVSKVLALR